MFGGQFGHTRFGLPSADDLEIPVTASFSDTLKGVTGFGVVTNIEETFFDGFKATVRVTASLPTQFEAYDSLKALIDLIGGVVVSFTPVEALLSKSTIIVEPVVSVEFTWDLEAAIWVGKDMYVSRDSIYSSDRLLSSVYASKDIAHSQSMTDILSAYASTVILYTDTIFISAEIPPGGVLDIDSDTYDVLLNGENILHLHDGGWLFLDRSLVRISIDSGTGGTIEGKVLYKERYL